MTRTVDIEVAAGAVPTVVQGPDDPSGVPALVVIPSIFGPAPDLLERVGTLAGDTLVVVPDPFWRTGEGAVAYDDIDAAIGRLADFDATACRAEMDAVVAWARASGNGRVVVVGICFGGPVVVGMGRAGTVDGIVTWHGSRMDQYLDGVGGIVCPVRHHVGGADPVVPPAALSAIEHAFALHPDCEIVVHEGAGHGFSHDGDSWDQAAHDAGFASVVELVDRVR